MVYPAFLVGFGLLAVLFIFLVVVPRFAAMFHGKLDRLPLLSYLVIGFGMWFRQHLALASALVVGIGALAGYGLARAPAVSRAWCAASPRSMKTPYATGPGSCSRSSNRWQSF